MTNMTREFIKTWGLYGFGTILFLLSSYSDLLFLFGSCLIFISTYYFLKNDSLKRILPLMVVAIGFMLFFLKDMLFFIEALAFMVSPMVFHIYMKEKKERYFMALVLMSLTILSFQFIYFQLNPQFFEEIIIQFKKGINENSFLISQVSEEQLVFIKNKMIPFYERIFYFLRFFEIFIVNYLLALICHKSMKKIDEEIFPRARFAEISLPGVVLWVFIVALAGQILFDGNWFDFFLNAMMFCLFLYFIYGCALSALRLKRMEKKGLFIIMLIAAFIFVPPFIFIYFVLFGLSDYWLNWKARFKQA